jgi:hypothetical protein
VCVSVCVCACVYVCVIERTSSLCLPKPADSIMTWQTEFTFV